MLDPGVVAAATQAGVGSSTLEEMQRLLARAPASKKMKERATPLSVGGGPLSETEEEDGPAEEGDAGTPSGASTDPMTQAVFKLTDLVTALAEGKKSSSRLESALDNVNAGLGEGSGYGTGKRSAAARRALRAALVDAPEELSSIVERLMLEDLSGQTQTPGLPGPTLCARAWVEHRSRIGHFRSVAHASWGVAGWT